MNNTKELVPFAFEGHQIRVIKDEKGEPWFIARDVCIALGYVKPENAVARHCTHSHTTPKQGGGFLTVIPESDLYRLILRSNVQRAERFQAWVTEDVLPAIRKTGGYIMGEEKMSEDELVLAAMQVLQRKVEEKQRKIEEQQQQIIEKCVQLGEQQPMVDSYNHLMNSYGLFNFRNAARVLGVAERDFITWLRRRGFLTQEKGNKPAAEFRKVGMFEVKTYYNDVNGHVGTQTFITPKGLEFFRRKYC
jgi:prophage antirepressor-like protein